MHGDGCAAVVCEAQLLAGLVGKGDRRRLQRPVGHDQVEDGAAVGALIERTQRGALGGKQGTAVECCADHGDGGGKPPEYADRGHGRCSRVCQPPYSGIDSEPGACCLARRAVLTMI